MLLLVAKVTKTVGWRRKPSARMGGHVCEANVRDSLGLRPLKNNRRVLRRAEAPLVHSLFSLPPSPFLCHWQRSTPSPKPHESDGVNIAAFVMRYAMGGQKSAMYCTQQHMPCNTSHGGITRLCIIYCINSWLCLTGRL